MMQKSGFYVSDRLDQVGFRLFFENGYGISVIFGPECGSDEVLVKKSSTGAEYFCENAEIAVINKNGDIVPFRKNENVKEFSQPEDLPQILSWAIKR